MVGDEAAFLETLVLEPHDASQYSKIVDAIKNKISSARQEEAYYEQVVNSSKYSYEVKQKAVFFMPDLDASRLWGFGNLSGEALCVLVGNSIKYSYGNITDPCLMALAANPAFISSLGSKFDAPQVAYERHYGYYKEVDIEIRETLTQYIVASSNMSFELARLILEAYNPDLPLFFLNEEPFNAAPVLDWTRKAYGLPESIPDAWVRNLLGGVPV